MCLGGFLSGVVEEQCLQAIVYWEGLWLCGAPVFAGIWFGLQAERGTKI
jgi:hypothetical protein